MFVIAECNLQNGCPNLNACYIRETLHQAQGLATQLVVDQLSEPEDDDAEKIRLELAADYSYYDPNSEWSVCISEVRAHFDKGNP